MRKVIVIGHSHTIALNQAHARLRNPADPDFDFLLLREVAVRLPPTPGMTEEAHKATTNTVDGIDRAKVAARIAQAAADVAVLCISGNEHAALGLIKSRDVGVAQKIAYVEKAIATRLPPWLDFLLPLLPKRVLFYTAPPPIAAGALEGKFPAERITMFKGKMLEPPSVRLQVWQHQCRAVRAVCERYGIEFVDPPPRVFDASGMLARACWSDEPTHGGVEYGRLVLDRLIEVIDGVPASSETPRATEVVGRGKHPYAELPDASFWKQSISLVAPAEVDPVSAPPFTIARTDRVATAGSCFAQHISKRLRKSGFKYFVTESTPDAAAGERRGFYDFSARYGNLYTARQLLQLFDRAFGYFRPIDRVWKRHDGGFCDPFRPRIEPDGFASEAAVEQDRNRHHQAVRRMFRQLDVLVFTLGLTECWVSRLDGAVYPVAPGVVGGDFDPAQHAFVNFTVRETVADLEAFIAKLKLVNPQARMILTVSPVPLVATAADRHVLVSTTYSKSVLRVAAEEVSRAHAHVCYFPSYEIITGPHARGSYFEADRRSVTEAGVDHVMRVFMAHMTAPGTAAASTDRVQADADSDAAIAEMEALADAACDEEMLAR